MNDHSIDTNIFVQVKGKNGNIYSFADYEKEFTKWFNDDFLPAVASNKKDKLKSFLFPAIIFWSDSKGWTSLDKSDYLKNFPLSLTKERFRGNKLKELSISDEDLNSMIFEKKLYKTFL